MTLSGGLGRRGARRRITAAAPIAVLVLGSVWLSAPAAGASPVPAAAGSSVVSVAPVRVLDTRIGTGVRRGAVAPGGRVTVSVAGGAVPDGASAVLLNVAVTDTRAAGYLQVVAHGTSAGTSSVNFAAGQTVSNLVLTRLSASGQVDIVSRSAGSVDLVADVEAYLPGSASVNGLQVLSPTRVLDTRIGLGAPRTPVPAGGRITVRVGGVGQVPASALSGLVNVVATDVRAGGYLQVFSHDAPVPTSAVNLTPGRTVSNLVLTGMSRAGLMDIVNRSSAPLDVVADVEAYLPSTVTPGELTVLSPGRVLDTRSGVGAPKAAVPAGGLVRVQVAGAADTPTSLASVVLNVAVTDTRAGGYLQVYADGAPTRTSTVNFAAGQTASNLALTGLSSSGIVDIVNHSTSSVDLIADATGYIPTTTPADEWSSVFGDAGHNATDPGLGIITSGNAANLALAWTVPMQGDSSAVASGQTIYELGQDDQGSALNALDATTGAVIWHTHLRLGYTQGPLVLQDGRIYVTFDNPSTGHAVVSAYDAATGAARWTNDVAARAGQIYDLAVDSGRVTVSVDDGSIQTFDATTGRRLWAVFPSQSHGAHPGVNYQVTAYHGRLYLDTGTTVDVWDSATGRRLWADNTSPAGYFDQIVVADGHVIIPGAGVISAYNADGCGQLLCAPQWVTSATFPGADPNNYGPSRVTLGGLANGRLYFTSFGFSADPAPEWLDSVDVTTGQRGTGSSLGVYGGTGPPIVAGHMIWMFGADLVGYPDNCADTCAPLVHIDTSQHDDNTAILSVGGGDIILNDFIDIYAYRVFPGHG